MLGTFILVAALLPQAVASTETTVNYPRAAEPIIAPALIPLRPGDVEPAGWLRDWAIAARDGITGHLDERHPTFRDGWKGIDIKTEGATPGGLGWPLEQSAYWLDGLLRLGYILHDDALIEKAKLRLDPIVDGINAGGMSFTYWTKDRPSGFNTWAHGQMGRALATYYAATGEKRILDALVRVYRDYRLEDDLTATFTETTGLDNIDPMLETYAWSGDRQILDRVLAALRFPKTARLIDQWAAGRIGDGHGVHILEQTRVPGLCYPWTGDRHLLDASLRVQDWLDGRHMLPYGVNSAEEFVCGIGALRMTETCDVQCYLWANIGYLRILGDRRFADRIERAFFNAGPATVSRDFQTMSYYQSPNRISRSLPSPPKAPQIPVEGFTPLGHPIVICCVGNVNRIIPNYVSHMWMATGDGGLAAALYGPCKVSALAGDRVPVEIACRTNYPFDETIRVEVSPRRTARFPLYFRIPAWCQRSEIMVNRSPQAARPAADGFVRIEREWSKGDIVELRLTMPVRIECGYETEYPKVKYWWKKTAVFDRRRLPYASVHYGPLLMALPIADVDPNTPRADAKWNYALDNDGAKPGVDVRVERSPMPSYWDWPLAAPLTVTIPAREFAWHPSDRQALPDAPVAATGPSVTIRLVPYGCTKFRISMFPVTPRAWADGVSAPPRSGP
jgi:uncharacterized protein